MSLSNSFWKFGALISIVVREQEKCEFHFKSTTVKKKTFMRLLITFDDDKPLETVPFKMLNHHLFISQLFLGANST